MQVLGLARLCHAVQGTSAGWLSVILRKGHPRGWCSYSDLLLRQRSFRHLLQFHTQASSEDWCSYNAWFSVSAVCLSSIGANVLLHNDHSVHLNVWPPAKLFTAFNFSISSDYLCRAHTNVFINSTNSERIGWLKCPSVKRMMNGTMLCFISNKFFALSGSVFFVNSLTHWSKMARSALSELHRVQTRRLNYEKYRAQATSQQPVLVKQTWIPEFVPRYVHVRDQAVEKSWKENPLFKQRYKFWSFGGHSRSGNWLVTMKKSDRRQMVNSMPRHEEAHRWSIFPLCINRSTVNATIRNVFSFS